MVGWVIYHANYGKSSPNEYQVCPTLTSEWYSAHSNAIAGKLAAPLTATAPDTATPIAATHQR